MRLGLASKRASGVISYTPSGFFVNKGFRSIVCSSSIFRRTAVKEVCSSTSGSTILSNHADINWSGASEKAFGSAASTLVRIYGLHRRLIEELVDRKRSHAPPY